MFSQNKEETKLDWMYKGANALVDREEYLLGRSVDKTLEQLNAEEKQKATNQFAQPKNHVEHECIPPSIRDYNKISLADQVDLAAKLQEDPLVAIRKREEETRKQFLQNPIQLKKLQKALKKQEKVNKKKKSKKSKHSKSNKDIDAKLMEKLNQLKNNPLGLDITLPNKKLDRDEELDTVLIHKFNKLKNKLTEKDIKAILEGQETTDDDSASSSERRMMKHITSKSRKYYPREQCRRRYHSSDSEEEVKKSKQKTHNVQKHGKRNDRRNSTRSDSCSSTESDSNTKKKRNWGLVTHDGKKIELHKNNDRYKKESREQKSTHTSTSSSKPKVKLSGTERERKRNEMMANAAWRDKEREKNVRKYREEDTLELKQQDFNPDFLHNQLAKAASMSSVEGRIKSNVNNIQRSSTHMDKNFSRRH